MGSRIWQRFSTEDFSNQKAFLTSFLYQAELDFAQSLSFIDSNSNLTLKEGIHSPAIINKAKYLTLIEQITYRCSSNVGSSNKIRKFYESFLGRQ